MPEYGMVYLEEWCIPGCVQGVYIPGCTTYPPGYYLPTPVYYLPTWVYLRLCTGCTSVYALGVPPSEHRVSSRLSIGYPPSVQQCARLRNSVPVCATVCLSARL